MTPSAAVCTTRASSASAVAAATPSERREEQHEERLARPDAGGCDHDHDADGVRQREGAAERGDIVPGQPGTSSTSATA